MKNLILLSVIFLVACSTNQPRQVATGQAEGAIVQDIDYGDVIDANTQTKAVYDGFSNLFQFHATMLNTNVIEAQLQRQAKMYQWNNSKLSEEREKILQQFSNNTQIFLAFYTPTRSENNLASDKSLWRVFLDSNGQRYVGQIKLIRKQVAELASLYPYYNRWAKAYQITFPVSLNSVEGSAATLTITGSVGSSSVVFPATK